MGGGGFYNLRRGIFYLKTNRGKLAKIKYALYFWGEKREMQNEMKGKNWHIKPGTGRGGATFGKYQIDNNNLNINTKLFRSKIYYKTFNNFKKYNNVIK